MRDLQSDTGGQFTWAVSCPPLLWEGGEVKDELWQEMTVALTQLAVHSGIMNATLQLPQYETAQEGWRQRMREIRDWANRQTEEIHDFAEHFD